MDAFPPAGNIRHPGVSVPAPESRDQLVVRRRAAQRAWRAACERTEQASRRLHEALDAPLSSATANARERLERAEHGERRARSAYYRVAEEIGVLLSRLERRHAGPA
jgi:hypothetical protein